MGGGQSREGQEIDDRDRQLLEAWRRGDRAAGNELFERHYESIARFFHNKVSEPAQDDLIHETFLACMTGASRFRGESRFRTFLFGIAHHVLADYIRRLNRRMARLGSETDAEEAPDESPDLSPVANVVQRQDQRLLLEALRRIPLIHQVALELHYWEDLTAAEIGDVLGVPLGTAKTRLRDGRVYLEQQLRELSTSPDALRTTTDDLAQWAKRMRDKSGQEPSAIPPSAAKEEEEEGDPEPDDT